MRSMTSLLKQKPLAFNTNQCNKYISLYTKYRLIQYRMPLIAPTVFETDLPKLTPRDFAKIRGKVMLMNLTDTVPTHLKVPVDLKTSGPFFAPTTLEYFYRCQLPDDTVILYESIDRAAWGGISEAGKRGLVLNNDNMVVRIIQRGKILTRSGERAKRFTPTPPFQANLEAFDLNNMGCLL